MWSISTQRKTNTQRTIFIYRACTQRISIPTHIQDTLTGNEETEGEESTGAERRKTSPST